MTRGNLSLSLASFVGRERELDEIGALVREHRLVTLTGSGGVGKTQTALQVATALSDAGAVWFVGLAPISDPSLMPAAIASVLHVQQVPNRPLLETLLEYLKHKTLLLILAIANMSSCKLRRLPTLCWRTARVFGSLRPAASRFAPGANRPIGSHRGALREAVALFCDRARAIDHHFALTDDIAPAVAELCRRLDGIPLAIELAAARVDSLAITALVERLEARFRVLAGGERTALPRQQTMRATIDWSYDLLSARSSASSSASRSSPAVARRPARERSAPARTSRRPTCSISSHHWSTSRWSSPSLTASSHVIASRSRFGSMRARSSSIAVQQKSWRTVTRSRASSWPNNLSAPTTRSLKKSF